MTTSGTDIKSCFSGTYKTKESKLRRAREKAYKFISRNEHFISPLNSKRNLLFVFFFFKEEFIVKKALTFEVLGKK